jgi:hypothetical protein
MRSSNRSNCNGREPSERCFWLRHETLLDREKERRFRQFFQKKRVTVVPFRTLHLTTESKRKRRSRPQRNGLSSVRLQFTNTIQ